MATVTFKGEEASTLGTLPAVGSKAPDFVLKDKNLGEITLESFAGKTLVLNIVPCLETSTCALSEKKFKEKIPGDIVVITISRDTPFVFARIEEESPMKENAISASDMSHKFGDAYQCTLTTSPLKDFLSRAVIVLDKDRKVVYTEQVAEISSEPNYDAVLEILKGL